METGLTQHSRATRVLFRSPNPRLSAEGTGFPWEGGRPQQNVLTKRALCRPSRCSWPGTAGGTLLGERRRQLSGPEAEGSLCRQSTHAIAAEMPSVPPTQEPGCPRALGAVSLGVTGPARKTYRGWHVRHPRTRATR